MDTTLQTVIDVASKGAPVVLSLVAIAAARRTNNAKAAKIEAEAKSTEVNAVRELEKSYVQFTDRLESRINELEKRVATLEGERDQYCQEAATLQEQLDEANQVIAQLRRENEELTAKSLALQKRIDDLQARLDNLLRENNLDELG